MEFWIWIGYTSPWQNNDVSLNPGSQFQLPGTSTTMSYFSIYFGCYNRCTRYVICLTGGGLRQRSAGSLTPPCAVNIVPPPPKKMTKMEPILLQTEQRIRCFELLLLYITTNWYKLGMQVITQWKSRRVIRSGHLWLHLTSLLLTYTNTLFWHALYVHTIGIIFV